MLGPVFGPDSCQVVYAAMEKGVWVLVANGIRHQRYDLVLPKCADPTRLAAPFAFEAPDRFHYIAVRGTKLLHVEAKLTP